MVAIGEINGVLFPGRFDAVHIILILTFFWRLAAPQFVVVGLVVRDDEAAVGRAGVHVTLGPIQRVVDAGTVDVEQTGDLALSYATPTLEPTTRHRYHLRSPTTGRGKGKGNC